MDKRMQTLYQNNRIRIRPYQQEDEQGMCECILHSITEMKPYLPWVYDGYQLADSQRWIEWAQRNWQCGVQYDFVIEDIDTGRFLGGVGLLDVNQTSKSATLGYWLDSRFSGQGFAYQAAKLAVEFAEQQLKLQQITIYMSTDNNASRHIAKKLGAIYQKTVEQYEMVNGNAVDCDFYQLIFSAAPAREELVIFMKYPPN